MLWWSHLIKLLFVEESRARSFFPYLSFFVFFHSDIKKARLLLRSVTSTNPLHAPGFPCLDFHLFLIERYFLLVWLLNQIYVSGLILVGWIAAARLEEQAGKLAAARSLIAEGCEHCPTNEDVWLESSRLQTPENARKVLARAIQHIPHSVKIWLQASSMENEVKLKKRILRRGDFFLFHFCSWKLFIDAFSLSFFFLFTLNPFFSSWWLLFCLMLLSLFLVRCLSCPSSWTYSEFCENLEGGSVLGRTWRCAYFTLSSGRVSYSLIFSFSCTSRLTFDGFCS